MFTIELTVIEAAQLADILEALHNHGVNVHGKEKLPQEYVIGLAMAEEIMERVHNRQAANNRQ